MCKWHETEHRDPDCERCQLDAARQKATATLEKLNASTMRRGRAGRQVAEARDEARRSGAVPRVIEVSGVFHVADLQKG